MHTVAQVFDEFVAETPRDLLAKELWCKSISAVEWRKSVRNFSHSVAVMSVIGAVIGLGDRHLSNILIDWVTGEVVHIDYNLCFEKAKTLRVPERVPFRLTQNIEEAMGLTGVEVSVFFLLSTFKPVSKIKKFYTNNMKSTQTAYLCPSGLFTQSLSRSY